MTMNNNWHIKISDCSEAQKERLKRVYGSQIDTCNFFGLTWRGFYFYGCKPDSELITPDEAFERLGLDDSYTVKKLIQANETLCEKIKELEQQLADKPEPQGIDWSIVELEYKWLAQNLHSGDVDFYEVKPTGDSYILLATRPKPKYDDAELKLLKDFYDWLPIEDNGLLKAYIEGDSHE